MNIGQLIRSFVGELQPADAKTLELKVGQIVKGLVMQLLSEQDALVNIGGVQVRAKLETPLKQGDTTLLQVQPESASGQIILKPLQSSDVPIAEESLPELLKSFGLKDQPAARQAVHTLQREGLPLTKETAAPFVGLAQQRPAGVPEREWEQTLVLALKKDLPLTQEGMVSLHRALFGGQLSENLDRLSAQIKTVLQNGTPLPFDTQKLLGQIRGLVDEIHLIGNQVAQGSVSQNGGTDPARAVLPGSGGKMPGNGGTDPARAVVPGSGEMLPDLPEPAGSPARLAAPTQAAPVQPAAQAEAVPAAHSPSAAAGAPQIGAAVGPAAAAPAANVQPVTGDVRADGAAETPVKLQAKDTPTDARVTGLKVAAVPQNAEDSANGSSALESAAVPSDAEQAAPPLARLLKLLGVDNEQKIAKLADELSQPAAGAVKPDEQAVVKHQAADTLKSLLLQAAGSEHLPSALKEQVQQVIQQITGQQLLMSPDRGALFTHMTLMIPIHHPDGGQTASIHIQSRKGKRGELDANNCRLLFDLDMKTLGGMLVDVQVYNRIVSLNIQNDHPVMETLLESQRTEITAGLETLGYQLSSLKTSPFPERKAAEEATAQTAKAFYETKPYKSVDFRV